MSIFITILFIIIASLITVIVALIVALKKVTVISLSTSKDNIELAKNNVENLKQCQESLKAHEEQYSDLVNKYILLDVAHSIAMMLLNLSCNNEEKYTFYFNNLYFFGIPKESLKDYDAITQFHNNCLENKYILVPAEKPFKYSFILKDDLSDSEED